MESLFTAEHWTLYIDVDQIDRRFKHILLQMKAFTDIGKGSALLH